MTRVAFTSLWLLVFAIPLENVMIPGVGLLGVVVGIVASGVCVLAMVERGTLRPVNAGHVLIGLFALWVGASSVWTLDAHGTAVQLGIYLRLIFMIWLVWQLAVEERDILRLLHAYVVGTFVAGLDTLYQFSRQSEAAYLRYAGAGQNPDDLGLMMALSVPLAYCFFIQGRTRLRWFYVAHMGLVVITILLSATRGAALAVAVALSIVPATATRVKSQHTAVILLTTAIVVIAGLFVIPDSSRARFATIPEELAGGSMSGRTSIWAAGLDAFREHPFIGVGAGAYKQAVRQVLVVPQVAHNTFLSIAVELGTIGLAIFCALLAVLLACATELPWLSRRLWLICLAVWLVGVSSLTWEIRKPTWLFFGLLLSHHGSFVRHPAIALSPRQRLAHS